MQKNSLGLTGIDLAIFFNLLTIKISFIFVFLLFNFLITPLTKKDLTFTPNKFFYFALSLILDNWKLNIWKNRWSSYQFSY